MQVLINKLPGRASSFWNWSMALGVLGYLISKQTPPTMWSYPDWLQFLFVLFTAASGKAGWSPLDKKD